MTHRDVSELKTVGACIVVAVFVFVFDLLVPLGVAAGVSYVVTIFLSLGLRFRKATYVAASFASILTLLGWVLSPKGGEDWKVALNRLLSLFVIWSVAILCAKLKQTVEDQEENEEQLKASERRIRAIVDTAVDPIITISGIGLIKSFNAAAEQLFGYSEAEVLEKNIKMLMPAPYRDEHDGYLANFMATGEKHVIGTGREVVGLHKEGKQIPIHLAVSQVSNNAGTQPAEMLFTGIIHDLTEQKQHEALLIAGERRIKAIVNTAVDPIITISGVGLIKSFNPAAERLFGYTESEVLEKNVKLLMPAPYRDEHDGYLARFLQTGEQRVIGVGREVVGQHKNGRMIPIHLSVSQALDKNEDNDEDILFTGIIRDLTEQNQRQKELLFANRRAEKYSAFGQILNRSLNEIYIFDAETLHFVHVNRGARDNIGYTTKELRQMTPIDIKPEYTTESFVERVGPLLELKQDNLEFEAIHKRKDGSVYPVHVYLETSVLNERPVFVAVILDITERQKIEQTLRDSTERAQESDRAKSSFLANMSHEIRTPMTAILGYAESLLDGDHSESERLNCIHTIRRNGEYLIELINDILDLSKIESGKMTTEQVAMQPCRVIAEVISLMGVRADAKKLKFQVEYDGAIPETIQSDPIRLRQILINLIGNAIKFTAAGTIRLAISFIDDNEPRLQFDVIDSGCGMTEEQIKKLFQPFMQADVSTTRQFGGTGLGLTISKRFADLLGGDICVAASEPGVGSTFRATVATGSLAGLKMLDDPLAATEVGENKAAAKIHHVSLAGLRILLAEDGPDNQRLISFVLKKAGATVAIASNGQIAFEAAKGALDEGMPFDAVLMDMQMPVLDGYQATAKIREYGFDELPIIALTANAMAGDREKCIEAGCDDYATKPIDRKQLVDTIMTVVIEKRANAVIS